MQVNQAEIERSTTEELRAALVEYTVEVERLTAEKHRVDRDRDVYMWAVRLVGRELAAREGACIRLAR